MPRTKFLRVVQSCPWPLYRIIIGHRPAFLVSTPFHRRGIIESMAAHYLIHHPMFDPNITVHVLEVTAVAAGSVSLV